MLERPASGAVGIGSQLLTASFQQPQLPKRVALCPLGAAGRLFGAGTNRLNSGAGAGEGWPAPRRAGGAAHMRSAQPARGSGAAAAQS